MRRPVNKCPFTDHDRARLPHKICSVSTCSYHIVMVMIQRITAHALLLVILLLGISTQARSPDLLSTVSQGEVTTNVKDTTQEVKDESSAYESVVQDWNLVCEQLCRAGLGGPLCAPQCDNITEAYKEVRAEAAAYLLGNQGSDICSILCLYELGELSCTCNERTSLPIHSLNRNTVCKAFCLLGNITVSGCSQCIGLIPESASSDSMSSTTNFVSTTGTTQKAYESQAQKVVAAAGDEAVQTSTSSTTPDWNEFCLSLCKIGEGGSLCNCDLPPFF